MKATQETRKRPSKYAQPSHEEIALHAELIWQERGCPYGQDQEIWLEAERQLIEESHELTARRM